MGRVRGWLVAAAAAVLMVTAGCGLLGGRQGNAADAAGTAPVAAEASSEPPNLYEEATPEPATPEPSRSTATTRPKAAKPTPTEDPNNFTEPECATHEGKNVSKKAAKSALLSAAGRTIGRPRRPSSRCRPTWSRRWPGTRAAGSPTS